ncbi:GumC family protein [Methylorubrum populi]|uniref:GumC family protein n=1 Tax=Methylorubrum populi TaxID=223967 RepID=UPI002F353E01
MPSRIFVGTGPSKSDVTPEPWFLDPREVLRVLRPRWPLVLAPAILLVAAAAAWLVLVPPRYAAVTQILIDPRGIQVVKDGVTPSDQASDASLLLVDSQIRVLISDDVLRKVVDRFGLDHDLEFVQPGSFLDTLKGRLSSLLGASGGGASDDKLTALRMLRDRAGARRLERSFVVELSVTSESRQKAADLSQAIAETYLATVSEAQAQITRKAGAALSGRLGELQDNLRQAEDKAQQFRAANNLVGTRGQLVSEQALTQLNQQLGAARARAGELRGRLAQIEALANGRVDLNSVTEVVQSATIAQLRSQLAQVESARADTVANLGPRHPTLRTSELQVQSLRSQIEAEIRRIAAAARNDYKSAQANEASLAATLESRKKEALSVDKSFVRLRELERQVEASRAVYESFLVRARELQEQQRLDTSSSRIISPASLPARRLGPPIPVIFGAALAAGLGLGVMLALLAVPAAGRIGSARRLQQAAGLPVIAALPERARGKACPRRPARRCAPTACPRACAGNPLSASRAACATRPPGSPRSSIAAAPCGRRSGRIPATPRRARPSRALVRSSRSRTGPPACRTPRSRRSCGRRASGAGTGSRRRFRSRASRRAAAGSSWRRCPTRASCRAPGSGWSTCSANWTSRASGGATGTAGCCWLGPRPTRPSWRPGSPRR